LFLDALWPIGSYVIIGLYAVATIALAGFGLHLYVLGYLCARRSAKVRSEQRASIAAFQAQTPPNEWPIVTSQIPIYNEATVAARVIEAVARMNYPAGRHEVQVLDDSTDETRDIVDRTARRLCREGFDITVIRRAERGGFKAGALANGLRTCRGVHVAIFDADFVPPPDFLQRAVALLETDHKIGCAQGRWSHLNQEESWLTRGAALGMDGHFGVEQGARGWNGYFLNFNGTAGVWRKAAVEDPAVGGWSADTLTEDLDLSYRAQMAGWKICYCIDLPCPAELPAEVNALKAQQRRWAKGSLQVAVKLLPVVWRSRMSLLQKLEASLHLTHYLTAVGMVLFPLVALPLLFDERFQALSEWVGALWALVFISAAAPPIVYCYARRNIGGGGSGWKSVPLLMVLGAGLSLNNAVAAIAGLFQRGGVFERTPKRGSTRKGVRKDRYFAPGNRMSCVVEITLGAYCLGVLGVYAMAGRPFVAAFMLLYAAGYTTLGLLSLQAERRRAMELTLEQSLGDEDLIRSLPDATVSVRGRSLEIAAASAEQAAAS
jgi:cellulose synthase/poly-beta-1,6-N-acetylglucosamine synthase-like glycosyltransferase